MWVLQGHYRSERDFSFEGLEAARVRRLGWRNQIAALLQNTEAEKGNGTTAVLDALNNDLGSPQAFAEIDNMKLDLEDWQAIEELSLIHI